MAEESKTEEKREEREDTEKREDASVHAKLDKLGAHLDSLHKRMDSYESSRKDEDEDEEEEEEEKEEREDVEGYSEGGEFHPIRGSKGYSRSEAGEGRKSRKGKKKSRRDSDKDEREDSEEKESDRKALKEEREENNLKENDSKKKDSEKEEKREDSRNDAQAAELAALKEQNATLVSRLSAVEAHVKDAGTEDRAKFAAVWNQDEKLCQLFGDSAKGSGPDKWWPGETLAAYARRTASKYKKYSGRWKDVDLNNITDDATFANVSTEIYNDAQTAAMRGDAAPPGQLQRVEVVDPYSHSRRIEWRGDDNGATWHQFANPRPVKTA